MAKPRGCSSAVRVTTMIGAVVIWVCVIAKIVAMRSIVIYALDVVSMMAIPKISVVQNIVMMGMTGWVGVGMMPIWL